MGFTTEQKSEDMKVQSGHTNPMKKKSLEAKKSEFYSFLQDLNCKTELGME